MQHLSFSLGQVVAVAILAAIAGALIYRAALLYFGQRNLARFLARQQSGSRPWPADDRGFPARRASDRTQVRP